MTLTHRTKISLYLFVIIMIFGCNIPNTPATLTFIPTETHTPTPVSPTPIPPTDTPLPTSTFTTTPSPTATATLTPTPSWVFQSGMITCPILLYHRIAEPPFPDSPGARYYTSPADFEWQMQELKRLGLLQPSRFRSWWLPS